MTTKISQCRLNANTSDLRPILSEQWVDTTKCHNNPKTALKGAFLGLESTLADNQCLTTTIVNHSNLNEKASVTTNQFTLPNLKRLVGNGKVFSVTFIKRTTGKPRTMNCRTGVTKYLKGGSKSFTDAHKQLLTVFDMNAKGYRSIPLEAITSLSVGGQQFTVGGAA